MNLKTFLLFFLLTGSHFLFGQINAVVIDSDSKKPVPYVNIWVEGKNTGTTSDENGRFLLKASVSETLVFSSLGYKTLKLRTDVINKTVQLQSDPITLDEIVLIAPKRTEEIQIGNFKKSKIHHYFACSGTPWIITRFFEHQPEYGRTPFLKDITVLTQSRVHNAMFNIRLYKKNEDGSPGGYITGKQITVKAKRGKHKTVINVSELNLRLPKEGFYVSVEWLIIDKNTYGLDFTPKRNKKKDIGYAPKFGAVFGKEEGISWIYVRGKWRKMHKNSSSSEDKYMMPAMALTLTN